jgi:hypothetical protein
MRVVFLLLASGLALAQQTEQNRKSEAASGELQEAEESPSDVEIEFVASDIFRSGSYIQPLWRRLGFEAHYFGGEETDVGFVGGSWTFRIRELKLAPGVGVTFGNNQFKTGPAFSFRWDYERGFFVTQGLVIQGFRDTPVFGEEEEGEHNGENREPISSVRPTISDGNHVSARWKRLTIGGTWEHIQFREGDEWKGGGRLGVRLLPRLSAILYVLGPGRAEWRGGILIHPPQHE